MGWLILILVLVALAFGVLGAVVKAVAFIVLTVIFTVLALGAIAYFALKHSTRRMMRDVDNGRQLPQ
jgi:hypothetical protein